MTFHPFTRLNRLLEIYLRTIRDSVGLADAGNRIALADAAEILEPASRR